MTSDQSTEAEVVGIVIFDDHGRVFVQRRSASRRLFPNTWDIVGGHVEPGETVQQTLERELTEETGWRLNEVVRTLGEVSWVGSDGVRRREYDFVVTVEGDLQAPQLEWDKHPEYRWIRRDELDLVLENRAPGDDLIKQIIEAAFATQ